MTVINWQNDPLLLDSEPAQVNHWLNANDLYQANRSHEIFLPETTQFNLYPLMVRRSDFVRKKKSDRILARFPFLGPPKVALAVIRKHILLVSEVVRDYFYKSINKSILEWKKVILGYLDRGTLPFPLYRCALHLLPELEQYLHGEYVPFTSARGEAFHMPTQLTKDLAYLCGMVNGDGHLEKYFLHIVDYSIANIKQLSEMFDKYFAQQGTISHKRENSPELVVNNLWVVRLFNFLTDQPIGGKKYGQLREPLILQEEPFRSYYWSGVMDADGTYRGGQAKLCSASEQYIRDFIAYLDANDIRATFHRRKDNTFVAYIPSRYHKIVNQILVSKHPEKQEEFSRLKFRGSKSEQYFKQFNETKLQDAYFNLPIIHGISIIGLEGFVRETRGNMKRTLFARNIGIDTSIIQAIELGRQKVKLDVLSKLFQTPTALLEFLYENQSIIRFRYRNSVPVKLTLIPTDTLIALSKQLKFYKMSITIPETDPLLKKKLELFFDIEITSNKIKNKLILDFYQIFGEFTV